MTLYWQSKDGRHAIYCGDCLDILPRIAKGEIDSVITSPPYNCGKAYEQTDDKIDLRQYWDWLETVFAKCANLLAPYGYMCVNHANYIGSRGQRIEVAEELEPMLGRLLPAVDKIIWDKGPANGAAWGNFKTSPRIRAQHEMVYINGGVQKMPPSDIEWDEWSKFTTSIWRIGTHDVDSTIHPAMMPTELAYRLCRLYSPADALILDPFCGTGTTGVACVRTDRRFIGIEISEKYCRESVRRIEAELAQPTLFEPKKRKHKQATIDGMVTP